MFCNRQNGPVVGKCGLTDTIVTWNYFHLNNGHDELEELSRYKRFPLQLVMCVFRNPAHNLKTIIRKLMGRLLMTVSDQINRFKSVR